VGANHRAGARYWPHAQAPKQESENQAAFAGKQLVIALTKGESEVSRPSNVVALSSGCSTLPTAERRRL
jgi:hypothetical protein